MGQNKRWNSPLTTERDGFIDRCSVDGRMKQVGGEKKERMVSEGDFIHCYKAESHPQHY